MNLELLYDDESNVFIEEITNISISPSQVFFKYKEEDADIPIKDLRTVTLFSDDWQHRIRHWVFKKE